MTRHLRFLILTLFTTLPIWSEAIRIMPLGDSITYDYRFTDEKNPRPSGIRTAYCNHLRHLLTQNGYDIDFVGSQISGEDIRPPFDPNHEGHKGWTSMQIASDTYTFLANNEPDIVLLHIGTNDAETSTDGIAYTLNEIDAYEHDTGHPIKVFVALIIDTKNQTEKTAVFNRHLEAMLYRRIVAGDNIVIVDMYRQAGLSASDYADFYHPNEEGYAKIAYLWYVALVNNFYDPFDTLPTIATVPIENYPKTLVDVTMIENQIIQDGTVTFETQIPDDGITFK